MSDVKFIWNNSYMNTMDELGLHANCGLHVNCSRRVDAYYSSQNGKSRRLLVWKSKLVTKRSGETKTNRRVVVKSSLQPLSETSRNEKRCVMTLITAAKETAGNVSTSTFSVGFTTTLISKVLSTYAENSSYLERGVGVDCYQTDIRLTAIRKKSIVNQLISPLNPV